MKNQQLHYGIFDIATGELVLDEDQIPCTGLNRAALVEEIIYQGMTEDWEVRPLTG